MLKRLTLSALVLVGCASRAAPPARPASVGSAEDSTVTFAAERGTLVAEVRDARDSTPVRSLHAMLTRGPARYLSSDLAGGWTRDTWAAFAAVPVGEYTLVVRSVGYTHVQQVVTVSPDRTDTVRVHLVPQRGCDLGCDPGDVVRRRPWWRFWP